MAILLHHNANEIVSRRSISDFYIRVQDMANQGYRVYRAQETSATEPFAIALLCGDVRCDVSQIYPICRCLPTLPGLLIIYLLQTQLYSGVIVLDGNRSRFAIPDWKTMLVIKVLRTRLRELLNRTFKQPGKLLTAQQEKWFDVWQRLFSQDFNQDKAVGTMSL